VLLVTVGLLLVSGLWGGLLAQLQVSVAGFTPVL
jgi:cytochrome c-type biogenesis protein